MDFPFSLFRLGECAILFSSFSTTCLSKYIFSWKTLFKFYRRSFSDFFLSNGLLSPCVCRICVFIHRVFQTFSSLYFETLQSNPLPSFTCLWLGAQARQPHRFVLRNLYIFINYSDFSLFPFLYLQTFFLYFLSSSWLCTRSTLCRNKV